MLEQYCKVAVGIGGGVGTASSFLCLTFPSGMVFAAAGVFGALTILSATVAVDVLREAKSTRPTEEGQTQDLLSALRSGLVLRMIILRSLQGVYETIMPALQLYYFTFVFKMDKETRLYWFGIAAVFFSVGELGFAPIWSQLFAKSTQLMLYVPLALRIADAVLTPVILSSSQDPRVFVAYLGFWRVCNASFSYWRIAACGWICDHHGQGEGMLLGMFSMVNNLGRALTNSLAVLGLSWAGLVTFNCLEKEGDALDMCEFDKLHSQPESLEVYLKAMIVWFAPIVEIIICVLTYEFPIRPGSKILEEVCRKKAMALSEKEHTQREVKLATASGHDLPSHPEVAGEQVQEGQA